MIDNKRIGRAIRTLREKAGFTQRELAEKLFVSDMAVSKWETGKSIPDVSTLKKMAVILDMDVDGLLDGTASWLDDSWVGVLYADKPVDRVLYDKPAIDYQISYFLLAGVRVVYIDAKEDQLAYIINRFHGGSSLGIELRMYQSWPKEANVMMITEPNFLYGVDLTRFFQRAMRHPDSIVNLQTVIGGKDGNRAATIQTQTYGYRSIPFYFFRSWSGEPITVTNGSLDDVFQNGSIIREPMDKGFIFSDLSEEKIEDITALIRSVQNICGYLICCPFEIAWRRGMIGYEKMKREGSSFPEYSDYLETL